MQAAAACARTQAHGPEKDQLHLLLLLRAVLQLLQ
jgi:hypothetical protein